MTHNKTWLLASAFALALAVLPSRAGDTPPKAATTSQFTPGDKGGKLLLDLYTNSYSWQDPTAAKMLTEWSDIVREGQRKTNVVTACTMTLGSMPRRSDVTARLGKPQATSDHPVPGMVSLGGQPMQGHFLWFGALGICFNTPEMDEKPDDIMVAIGYDPKRDKP